MPCNSFVKMKGLGQIFPCVVGNNIASDVQFLALRGSFRQQLMCVDVNAAWEGDEAGSL